MKRSQCKILLCSKTFFVISLLVGSLLFFCSLTGCFAKEATLCSKKRAQDVVEKALLSEINRSLRIASLKINILEVSELKLGGLTICEVVWELALPNQNNRNMTVQKLPRNIAYYGEGFVFVGELRVEKREGKEEKYVNITRDRFLALNKEYYEEVQKRIEQGAVREEIKKEVKELAKKEFDVLKSKADARFVSKRADAEMIIFTDPYCPHCAKMKDIVMKKVREGKINLYIFFTPILGPASENVSISAFCNGKNSEERLKLFAERRPNEALCEEGRRKIRENLEYFIKFNGKGVPYSFFKRGDDFKVFEGVISSNILDSLLN